MPVSLRRVSSESQGFEIDYTPSLSLPLSSLQLQRPVHTKIQVAHLNEFEENSTLHYGSDLQLVIAIIIIKATQGLLHSDRPTVSFNKAVFPGKDWWHSAVLTDVVSSHNLQIQNKKILLLLTIDLELLDHLVLLYVLPSLSLGGLI